MYTVYVINNDESSYELIQYFKASCARLKAQKLRFNFILLNNGHMRLKRGRVDLVKLDDIIQHVETQLNPVKPKTNERRKQRTEEYKALTSEAPPTNNNNAHQIEEELSSDDNVDIENDKDIINKRFGAVDLASMDAPNAMTGIKIHKSDDLLSKLYSRELVI